MTRPPPPRFFTPDYVERATLRDGTAIVLRLVTPEDKLQIAAGFARWSPESRYTRFLAPKTTLTDDELRYLTEIDQEHHFALGALRESDGLGIGIARFIQLPRLHATAEAAIAVSDEVKGRGLGKLLFLRLCAAAAERGIERFRCEVLAANTGMTSLIANISPERSIEVGSGVMSIDMLLPNVTPTAPPSTAQPPGGLYALLRAAAQNAVEWTDAVRRLWRRGRVDRVGRDRDGVSAERYTARMLKRTSTAVWRGTGPKGAGAISTLSGALKEQPYSVNSRFVAEDGRAGTNPEELIAAAHASCFTMATAFQITNAGHEPTQLETVATVSMDKQDQGWTITGIALELRGTVPGLTEDKFRALADEAKRTCPISRALAAVPITLTTKFE